MHVLIKKETELGKDEYLRITNIESAIFFDDVTARMQVEEDEFGQPIIAKPVKP